MLRGFRDFVMRGNVVDLAVGVVIGAAFNSVVQQFTASFLQPVIRRVGGGSGTVAGTWSIGHNQRLDWGAMANSTISFLLTAAVLYFLIVLPMNKLADHRRRLAGPPATPGPSDEVRLLGEIRDALIRLDGTPRSVAANQTPVPAQPGAAGSGRSAATSRSRRR